MDEQSKIEPKNNPAHLSPPLPLFKFIGLNDLSSDYEIPKTINGELIKTIENNIEVTSQSSNMKPDLLYDPLHSKKLAKWFSARSYKEINFRQMESFQSENNQNNHRLELNTEDIQRTELFDSVVYESLFHNESLHERNNRNMARCMDDNVLQEKYFKMDSESS
jgi:hypothetical protein